MSLHSKYSHRPSAPLSALIASLTLTFAFVVPASAIDVGDQAPNFTLRGLDGSTRSLVAEVGNTVVLFFFGHDAAVCSAAATQLQTEIYARYGDRDLVIFGIDCWDGTASQVDAFRLRHGIGYPLLLGGLGVARDLYGRLPYHSFVVIDGTGLVTYLSVGPGAEAFDFPALQSAIDRSLRNTSTTSDATWGAIKSLYGRKGFPRAT